MKVWKLEFKGLADIIYCDYADDVKEYIDNMEPDDILTIACENMTEEEYSNLPEFDGF